jgi:integrase
MLTSTKATNLKKTGMHTDRDGLYLNITKTGAKSWIYRYQLNGKRREMGLGSFTAYSLAEAREIAAPYRKMQKQGIDPMNYRDSLSSRNVSNSFRSCAEAYIKSHESGWKNPKHIKQWASTLEQYAYPVIGDMAVDQIDTEHVMQVLTPIWNTKTETASRVRGRIENVLSWAIVQKYRQSPNPAIWRGHLSMLLPKRSKVQQVQHHPALPYKEIPKLMALLRAIDSVPARAMELTILTCTRTNETIQATWGEIDFEEKLWIIPKDRMKAGREHRAPLSNQAISILELLPRLNDWVFPSTRTHISNNAMLLCLKNQLGFGNITVHGFRSTFRDWAAEVSTYPREVAEAALAHVVSDKTEAAYQRGDLLEKRRQMIQEWSNYCG